MRTTGPWPIEYDTLGKSDDPAVLLIMGLGMQLTSWPDVFCQALVSAGFRVVRFDNRDSGLSAHAGDAAPASVLLAAMRSFFGLPVSCPYTLQDMAQDAVAVMDELHIIRAHVLGVSMGGMIAQEMAAHFPQRVWSLTSVMSSSGKRSLSRPRLKAALALLRPPPDPGQTAALVEHLAKLFEVIGSPDYPQNPAALRQRIGQGIARAYSPAGTTRQLLAILASGDRRALLKTITAPTLVIHGDADPLIPLSSGKDTAQQIAGARLEVIPGMGHDLPDALLTPLAALVIAHCSSALSLAA